MVEKILIFVLFLGPLIFFHELGHFLCARYFGVRVEIFSIGFGPKLLKFKYGETLYTISLIPLGGYIKMFGDDITNKESVPIEKRKISFSHQSKWPRFCIVAGGPVANFILAFALFAGIVMMGEKVPELQIGSLNKDSILYERGLRSGDKIKKVNGIEVLRPTDMPASNKDFINTITILRFGEIVRIRLGISVEEFLDEFKKYPPLLRKPIVINKRGEKLAISLNKRNVDWEASISQIEHHINDAPIHLFKITKETEVDGEMVYATENKPIKTIITTRGTNLVSLLDDNNLKLLELMVKDVQEGGAAKNVGIQAKDVIISLDGKSIVSFNDLRDGLQEAPSKSVTIKFWRDNKIKEVALEPRLTERDGKKIRLMGVMSAGDYLPVKFNTTKPLGIMQSLYEAARRTWDTVVKVLDGFKKLISREMPFNQIGGPLRIGKVANDSLNISLSYFFQLMALISVNLGVINLFPIPILDGGHIMFIFLEILNRGPLSKKKMEIAQQVGLSLLLILMFGALFNDFSWFFSN